MKPWSNHEESFIGTRNFVHPTIAHDPRVHVEERGFRTPFQLSRFPSIPSAFNLAFGVQVVPEGEHTDSLPNDICRDALLDL